MAKRKLTLLLNIGSVDQQRYGLVDYDLADLTRGKEISVDEKTAAAFVKNGWADAPETAARRAAQPAGEGDEGEEESPVSDTNADEAIEAIGRMRSREKLQNVIDTDKRTTVQNAARERLTQL